MKTYLLAIVVVMSAGALPAAPSEEAVKLVATMELVHAIDFILRDEPSLPPEKDKALKAEFSSTAYINHAAEFLDANYSADELRELNRIWQTPLMQRLTKDMVGPTAPLSKHLGAWMHRYQTKKNALQKDADPK